MTYGIPYNGSKSRIAKDIVELLPDGKRLVDLFCGGCAITHAAIVAGKYSQYLANDVNAKMSRLFLDAIEGKFADEKRWISREDFFRLKDDEEIVNVVWSFGNNKNTYIYGKHIEPYKKACHYAVVEDDWTQLEKLCPETVDAAKDALRGMPTGTWQERRTRRIKFSPAIVNEVKRQWMSDEVIMANPLYKSIKLKKIHPTGEFLVNCTRIERIQELQSLESLERLQSLQSLQSLESLDYPMIQATSFSFEEYVHHEGDVVYCDPPYQGMSNTYGVDFNHDCFWEWARTRDYPVYVSEYSAPEDFAPIYEKPIQKLAAGGKSAHKKAMEKVFLNKKWEG